MTAFKLKVRLSVVSQGGWIKILNPLEIACSTGFQKVKK
jgi:hypothetical protein